MGRRGIALAVAALLLLSSRLVPAQSSATGGTVLGIVTDPGGARLPNVLVQAANSDTGLFQEVRSNPVGRYRFDLLPPGTYEIQAALSGFRTEVRQDVLVSLGSRVALDITLHLAPTEDEIVVTAATPLVEVSNADVKSSVGLTAITTLPLLGRDFTDLVLLTPAAVFGRGEYPGNEVASGHGGFNIGARAIYNSFNIDGVSSNSGFFGDERGGATAPFTFSQAVIAEFQVLRSTYDLRYSGSGGVINAITRSGTNTHRGEAFIFFTDDNLVAENASGDDLGEFAQWQYGLVLGGPLQRDRLHYLVAYDGQDKERPSFREFAGFPSGREGDWEARTGLDWERETGTLTRTDDVDVALVRLDWRISDAHWLNVRDNWADYRSENGVDPYRTSGSSHNGLASNSYNSLVGNLASLVSSQAFNDLTVQVATEGRPREPATTALPETRIGRFWDGAFGQNRQLPADLTEDRLEVLDHLTRLVATHTLKAGAILERVRYDNLFLLYGGGQYYYATWSDFLDDRPPLLYRQAFADPPGPSRFSTASYAAYLQDEWRPTPSVTLTYGLRYDLQDHARPPATNPLYPDTGRIPDDRDNWAPRLGFAWDVGARGEAVVRGGVGVFYDRTPAVLAGNAMLVNGVTVTQLTTFCSNAGACPTYPDLWASRGGLSATFPPDIFAFDADFENPETLRGSLGYERLVSPDTTVGIDLVVARSRRLERRQDRNLRATGELTVDGRPVYERFTVFPELGRVSVYMSDAVSHYKALVLRAHRRYAGGWMLDGSYTWSRSRDQDSNERAVSLDRNVPEDQYDLGAEWGPSDFDVTHKLVLSATVELPWDLLVSVIASARSGFPYTALHEKDLNGDGVDERSVVESSPGVYTHAGRNTERQPWVRTVNLRLAKAFTLGGQTRIEVIGEVFNLFDTGNWYVSRNHQVRSSGCTYDGSGELVPCTLVDGFGDTDLSGAPRSAQLAVKLHF